jgi:hypothetical protein
MQRVFESSHVQLKYYALAFDPKTVHCRFHESMKDTKIVKNL